MTSDAWRPIETRITTATITTGIAIGRIPWREFSFSRPVLIGPGPVDLAALMRADQARDATVKPQPLPAPPKDAES